MQQSTRLHCSAKDKDVTITLSFHKVNSLEGTTGYELGRCQCSNTFCDHVGCDIPKILKKN